MKRVIVIGCPGSGKSTFAKRLHAATGLPLYHLDMLYWNGDGTTVEKSLFLDRLSRILEQDEWIIDGNYASTMEWRMQACDTVVFLDYPPQVCLEGVRQRRGKPRSDIPWVEREEDPEFIRFIESYPETNRPQVLALLAQNPDKRTIVFSHRHAAEAFLAQL